MASDPSEKILTEELALQRAKMTAQMAVLREKLDVPAQVKKKFSKHPAVWFAGAAVLGLVIAQIPRSRKSRREIEYVAPEVRAAKAKSQPLRNTLVLMALKSAADYAKPMLMDWAKNSLANYLQGQAQGQGYGNAPGQPNAYTQQEPVRPQANV